MPTIPTALPSLRPRVAPIHTQVRTFRTLARAVSGQVGDSPTWVRIGATPVRKVFTGGKEVQTPVRTSHGKVGRFRREVGYSPPLLRVR